MIERAVAERLVAGERVPTNATTGQTRYKLGFSGHVTLTAPSYDQTGRRLLRPAIRLISPRLRLVSPLGNRLRGLRASHQTAYVREERVRELPSREG
jgi:hypothetical protein